MQTYILRYKNAQGEWQGVPAIRGLQGNSIASITLNDDYTLTINFTDGNSTTTSSIRGEKGEKGDTGNTGATGNGIASAVLNADYTLTLTFTDGTTYTTSSIRGATGEKGETGEQGEQGAKGDTGATGNGISSIAKTGTSGLVDTYTVTYTDGTTFTYNVTNGADGDGVSSVNGRQGVVTGLAEKLELPRKMYRYSVYEIQIDEYMFDLPPDYQAGDYATCTGENITNIIVDGAIDSTLHLNIKFYTSETIMDEWGDEYKLDGVASVIFKAGTNCSLDDSATLLDTPYYTDDSNYTDLTIVYPDGTPTFVAGNIYEITYRYIEIDNLVVAKCLEIEPASGG